MPAVSGVRIVGGKPLLKIDQSGRSTSLTSTPTGTSPNLTVSFSVVSPPTGITLYDSVTQSGNNIVLGLRNIAAGDNVAITTINGVIVVSASGSAGPIGPAGPSGVAGPVSVNFSFPGQPPEAQTVQVGIVRDFYLAFGDTNPFSYCVTPAASDAVFTLQYVRAAVTTVIGTITFAMGATSGTPSDLLTLNLQLGDVLQMVTPSAQDVSLTDIVITVILIRS